MSVTLELVAPNGGFKIDHMATHAGGLYGISNGGKLYQFNGTAWVVIINTFLSGSTIYFRLISAGGVLYAMSAENYVVGGAPVWAWDGVTTWTSLNLAGTYGTGINNFPLYGIEHGGKLTLTISTGSGWRVVQWSGSAWSNLTAFYASGTGPIILTSFGGVLYGVDSNSKLYTIIAGVVTSVSANATGSGLSHWTSPFIVIDHPLIDFGSSLYMGVIPQSDTATGLGALFRWNGSSAWTSLVPYDDDLAACRSLFLFGADLAMVRDPFSGDGNVYVFDGVSSFVPAVTAPSPQSLVVGLVFGGESYVLGRQVGFAIFGDLFKMVDSPVPDASIFNFGGLG